MRHEKLYLLDIIESADHIEEFIRDKTFEDFQSSELLRSAVVQKLSAIGEAAGRVSADLRSRHANIPWAQIIAFRNILVHAYFGIEWDLVWLAATRRCPDLRDQVHAIVAELPNSD